jgi:hypothetical protein
MTHLSAEEFVDLLDGALPAARRAHLEGCTTCRDESRALAGVAARAVDARDVPEPSPLFWEHLSARVRDGLGAPAVRTWRELVWWPGSAWAAGVASIALVLLVSQQSLHPARARMGEAPSHAVAAMDPVDDLDTDPAWALVRSVADEVADDDVHQEGISARPDAAERMTLELSSREKSELAQLLESELKRSSE